MLNERQEQTLLFGWARYDKRLDVMFAIPNGGKRNVIEATNFKRQGVKKGVPDIILPYPNKGYHGLFIEMKTTKNGKISPEQTEWLDALSKLGYYCCICYGFEEAKETIRLYLGGE